MSRPRGYGPAPGYGNGFGRGGHGGGGGGQRHSFQQFMAPRSEIVSGALLKAPTERPERPEGSEGAGSRAGATKVPAAKVPVFTAMALISLEGGGRGGGRKGGKDRVALVTNFVVAAGDDGLLYFHDSDGNLLKTHPTGHREGVRVVTLVYTGTQVNPVIVTGGEDGSLLRHDMTVWIDSRYVEERCGEMRRGEMR